MISNFLNYFRFPPSFLNPFIYPTAAQLPRLKLLAMPKRTGFPLLLISLFLLPQFLTPPPPLAAADHVTRPPAGPTIHTAHNGSASTPQQVHISLVGQDYMRVSWITGDKKVPPSTVEYGKVSGKYDRKATGQSTSYDYFFYASGKIHHVVIGPLEPATTYYYRCGGRGPEFSFKSPPSSFPVEFVVIGDLGQTKWTVSTLEHVESKDYDVFLLPGDLSYADYNQDLWDSFGRLVQPSASRRPWMVTEGNHDVEAIPVIYPDGFLAYNSRWLMPYQQSGSSSNLYYSFDVAGAHIIMLGSYTDFKEDSDQYNWLEADLGRIDRTRTPWVLVVVHAPWYNTNTAHKGEGESMRKSMEMLLYNARVDVVFSGHVHAYERFTRIYNNEADPCGPIYITIGDGGNKEGLAREFEEPGSMLSLFREASFGHGRLRILDGQLAQWSWVRNNDSVAHVSDQVLLESLSSTKSCNLTPHPNDEL